MMRWSAMISDDQRWANYPTSINMNAFVRITIQLILEKYSVLHWRGLHSLKWSHLFCSRHPNKRLLLFKRSKQFVRTDTISVRALRWPISQIVIFVFTPSIHNFEFWWHWIRLCDTRYTYLVPTYPAYVYHSWFRNSDKKSRGRQYANVWFDSLCSNRFENVFAMRAPVCDSQR